MTDEFYCVDVTYNTGEVRLYGPFPKGTCDAINFIARIKDAENSCVVSARIRQLNKP